MTLATVKLWGSTIGYVDMDANEAYARFEYEPEFVKRKIELAPLTMPVNSRIYQFPQRLASQNRTQSRRL